MDLCHRREGGKGCPVIAGLVLLLMVGLPAKGSSLDQPGQDSLKSKFASMVLAKGFRVEQQTPDRKGPSSLGPRIVPIDPGTSVFTPETPAIYLIFEPAHVMNFVHMVSARFFLENGPGKIAETPLGQDSLRMSWDDRYGLLELRKPSGGWTMGSYVVKIYVCSQGEEVFETAELVGTLTFMIAGPPTQPAPSARK